MNIIILYSSYLLLTIVLTVWVANTLFKNGKVFLVDIFNGNNELAAAVNNLLYVGFYLVNLGYAVYTLRTTEHVEFAREMIETLSLKMGTITLILGGMHFFNMFLFFRIRKRAIQNRHYEAIKQYER